MTYYYVLNLQGDVVGLIDENADFVAEYTYNAWGEILSITDADGNAITSATHIANINPLRYRGYYYDTETGFYYLQSRYYDPAMHRFINADSLASTGQGILGTNMFAYCLNNPTNRADPGGYESVATEDADGNGIPDYLEIRWKILSAEYRAWAVGERATVIESRISINCELEYAEISELNRMLGDYRVSEIIAASVCTKYYSITGRQFLLSNDCVTLEIVEHIRAYEWAVGDRAIPNTLAAGFIVVNMWNNEYDEDNVYDATKSIDIRLSDVVAGGGITSQASVFGYKDGIRDVYIGTERDPWRDER